MMPRINNLYQYSNSLTASWMWSPRCEGNKRRVLLRNMWKVELEWWYKENANKSSIPNSQKFLKLGEAPLSTQWSFSCLFGKHIVMMSLKCLHLELEPDLIISWLLVSHSVVSDSFRPYGLQHARLPVLHHLPKFAQTHFLESVMPSNHLILCHPLLLLPSIFPSIRVFTNESVLCIRWPKYWSFSLSMSLSNEYLGLISFRIDWFDLLAVQGTLKSLLQHHSSKASMPWPSTFFKVQHSHLCMTTGKTLALTRWIFVSKVMSLLFNILSRFVNYFWLVDHKVKFRKIIPTIWLIDRLIDMIYRCL